MSSTIEFEEVFGHNGSTYTVYSTITYELSGGWLRATRTDPAECPDVTILTVVVDGIDGEMCRSPTWTWELAQIAIFYTWWFDSQRDDLREKILAIEKAGDE